MTTATHIAINLSPVCNVWLKCVASYILYVTLSQLGSMETSYVYMMMYLIAIYTSLYQDSTARKVSLLAFNTA